jgi:exodeoxyribonuclease-1
MDKNQTLSLIQKELLFCTNEYFYGKSRPYVQTFICQHPQYQWPLCFDLRHDPNIYLKMSIQELTAAMKKQPKFIRTVRHNKHPVIMNPSYGDKFDEYKIIGPQTQMDLIIVYLYIFLLFSERSIKRILL